MNNKTIEKWTRTAIRYATPYKGKWIAEKNTHRGCCDFILLRYDNEKPQLFDTPEQALNARASKTAGWYH